MLESCRSNVIAAVDDAVESALIFSFHPGTFNLLARDFHLNKLVSRRGSRLRASFCTFLLPNESMSSLRLSPYVILSAISAELEPSQGATKWLRISITSACEHVSLSFFASRTPTK